MTKHNILTFLAALAVCLVLSVPAAAADKKVKLAYVEWDCALTTTNVVAAVLKEKMGYEVEMLPVAAAAMWQAVATGDVDAMVTAWLPVTHKEYFEKLKDKVENLGPLATGAGLFWVVPSYVTIDSIADLKGNAARFDGKIIGIDPGAGLMRLSEKALKEYGLSEYTLVEGSGATMTAALADAIKNKKWIVVTGWAPHWKYGRWELKNLADPKKILGEAEEIDTVVRKGLKDDMPEVYAFLDRFHWKDAGQLQTVMARNQEKGADPYKNAVTFINENPDQVDAWLGKK